MQRSMRIAAVGDVFFMIMRAQFQGAGDQGAQDMQINGFGNEIEGTGLEGIDGGFHIAMRGDDGHGQLRRLMLDMPDQINAVAVGQPHISQAQVKRMFSQQSAAFPECGRTVDINIHA